MKVAHGTMDCTYPYNRTWTFLAHPDPTFRYAAISFNVYTQEKSNLGSADWRTVPKKKCRHRVVMTRLLLGWGKVKKSLRFHIVDNKNVTIR
jgi:hypothetical protein